MLLDPLGQTLIEFRDSKHPSLGSSVLLDLVCLRARLLCAITPMLRIGLAEHSRIPSDGRQVVPA
jgi:hypothetical protein